jgi:hypothetical protein
VKYADIIRKVPSTSIATVTTTTTTTSSSSIRPQILLRTKNIAADAYTTTATTSVSVVDNMDGKSSGSAANPTANGMIASSSNKSTDMISTSTIAPSSLSSSSISSSSSSSTTNTTTTTTTTTSDHHDITMRDDITATSNTITRKGPVSWSSLLSKTATRPAIVSSGVDSPVIVDHKSSFDNDFFPPLQGRGPSTTTTTTTAATTTAETQWKRVAVNTAAITGSSSGSGSQSNGSSSSTGIGKGGTSVGRNDGWAVAPTAKKTMNKW